MPSVSATNYTKQPIVDISSGLPTITTPQRQAETQSPDAIPQTVRTSILAKALLKLHSWKNMGSKNGLVVGGVGALAGAGLIVAGTFTSNPLMITAGTITLIASVVILLNSLLAAAINAWKKRKTEEKPIDHSVPYSPPTKALVEPPSEEEIKANEEVHVDNTAATPKDQISSEIDTLASKITSQLPDIVEQVNGLFQISGEQIPYSFNSESIPLEDRKNTMNILREIANINIESLSMKEIPSVQNLKDLVNKIPKNICDAMHQFKGLTPVMWVDFAIKTVKACDNLFPEDLPSSPSEVLPPRKPEISREDREKTEEILKEISKMNSNPFEFTESSEKQLRDLINQIPENAIPDLEKMREMTQDTWIVFAKEQLKSFAVKN